jgi:hypothetical protein
MFRVICVDDANKPNDISAKNWIKKDRVYTVIRVFEQPLQNNAMAFQLEEVMPDAPYNSYLAVRFKPVEEVSDEVLYNLLEETLVN